MSNILALITARGGSKSIPHKNIVDLAGRPLIAYSIDSGLASEHVDRLVVSTDDDKIADIARSCGAEVPFMRPASLAEDSTPTLPVIQHVLTGLEELDGYRPTAVVLLQPTSPLRRSEHIDGCVELLLKSGADSVVTVIEVPHNFNPVSLLRFEGDRLRPYLSDDGPQVLRRQDKPVVYARNGPVVLVSTYEVLMRENDLYGSDTRGYLMDPESSIDVDSPFDLEIARQVLEKQSDA